MKISKWEDLDGQKNENYIVVISCGWVFIKNTENATLLEIYIKDVGNDIVLSILKAFGFNIEFEVPKITRWELIQKENWSVTTLSKEFKKHCVEGKCNRIEKYEFGGCPHSYNCLINWLEDLVEGE